MTESQGGQKIKSSKAFFSQLQDNVVHSKFDKSTKSSKQKIDKINKTASKFKL